MQNDFISGSLPVTGAEDIIDMVEDLTKMDIWYQVHIYDPWHDTTCLEVRISIFFNKTFLLINLSSVLKNSF